MTVVSNIDDVLMTNHTALTPPTPESKPDKTSAPTEELDHENIFDDAPKEEPEETAQDLDNSESESDDDESKPDKEKPDVDDYGNPKEKSRTYTEEEVNERINKAVRERLARANNQKEQPTQQQVAKQASEFEYNPDSDDSWQQQLEQFVEKTVSKMGQKQAQQQQQQREQEIQADFESKFTQGMGRFADFRDVVGAQPVTDAMTYALRGMSDPAAFIYAASKRNPAELQRIANIPDQYAQMVEMGKLEERMRKTSAATKAPKPVSKSRDDASIPVKQKSKEPTIEQLIAQSEAKRQKLLNQKRGR